MPVSGIVAYIQGDSPNVWDVASIDELSAINKAISAARNSDQSGFLYNDIDYEAGKLYNSNYDYIVRIKANWSGYELINKTTGTTFKICIFELPNHDGTY